MHTFLYVYSGHWNVEIAAQDEDYSSTDFEGDIRVKFRGHATDDDDIRRKFYHFGSMALTTV